MHVEQNWCPHVSWLDVAFFVSSRQIGHVKWRMIFSPSKKNGLPVVAFLGDSVKPKCIWRLKIRRNETLPRRG